MENRSPPLYKRFIPFVCTFAILITVMVIPVMADELDLFYYNVMDFSYPNDNRQFTSLQYTDSGQLYFVLPNRSLISYVDFVFTSTKSITGLYVQQGNSTTTNITNELTVVQIDSRNYRAYGNITPSDGSRIILKFESSGSTYIRPLRLNVATQASVSKEIDVDAEITDYSRNPASYYNISYRGSAVVARWATATTADLSQSYRAEMVLYDWQQFDYIDLLLSTNCSSFTSFNSLIGGITGTSVPYSINFIDSADTDNPAIYIISVRLDLTSVVRSVDSLLVQCTAQQTYGGGDNTFQILSASGLLRQEPIDPFLHWFTRLGEWLESGFASIVSALGGNADTSEMENEVDSIKDQMQNASDAMADFTRPNVNEVITNVELDTGTGTPFADMMAAFFENELIVSIITGSLAFTLFGILVG